jgi:hypothetical protein
MVIARIKLLLHLVIVQKWIGCKQLSRLGQTRVELITQNIFGFAMLRQGRIRGQSRDGDASHDIVPDGSRRKHVDEIEWWFEKWQHKLRETGRAHVELSERAIEIRPPKWARPTPRQKYPNVSGSLISSNSLPTIWTISSGRAAVCENRRLSHAIVKRACMPVLRMVDPAYTPGPIQQIVLTLFDAIDLVFSSA